MYDYKNQEMSIEQSAADPHQKKIKLASIVDNRVHLLLYFFNGHHTNANDFTMLRKLQKIVNVIPLIPKADSFTPLELLRMKMDVVN